MTSDVIFQSKLRDKVVAPWYWSIMGLLTLMVYLRNLMTKTSICYDLATYWATLKLMIPKKQRMKY